MKKIDDFQVIAGAPLSHVAEPIVATIRGARTSWAGQQYAGMSPRVFRVRGADVGVGIDAGCTNPVIRPATADLPIQALAQAVVPSCPSERDP